MNTAGSSSTSSNLSNTILAGIALTVLVAISAIWSTNNFNNQITYLATEEARNDWDKDQAFRRLATRHGGLYVRPDARTPPNPYLDHLPNRDVVTTDGQKLTLMNPAYMMSQMTKEFEAMYGIKGNITGQVLLNPANKADPWELLALKQFDKGVKEVTELSDINGQPYIRLMRPMVMTEGCVLCHGHLGFKVGDIRGGVSVSVPLTPYIQAAQESKNALLISHGAIWLIGMLATVSLYYRAEHQGLKRRHTEDALRKSESRLTEILDIAPEAVITIGSDMKIHLFNQGAERIFGYRSSEVLGQSMEMLMPQRLRQGHHRHIAEFNQSKDTYRLMDQREEVSGLRKDGSEFPASASVSKLEINGEFIFTVMLHDISERRRADKDRRIALFQAEKANLAKSDFLAAMSHELRTPLNAILGFADILSHEYLGPLGGNKYVEYAEDIHASGEHLLSLVNDILDISSIEAGKMSLHKEPISINSIVTESMELVAINADTKGVRLIKEIPDGLPPLYADRRSVRQILLNLLGNAIKFTPAGGNITLSVVSTGKNTSLIITDTGIGISNEKLPDLTKPFTRAERDPHKAVEGWGLGLAITKSLIDLHRGSLDIKSTIGKGTTVTVTLLNASS